MDEANCHTLFFELFRTLVGMYLSIFEKCVILMLQKFPSRQVTILLSNKPLPERGKFLYMENDKIQLFEDRKNRTEWDEEQEEWYFSVVDVVAVLTDSVDPTAYWRKLKQ